MCLAAQVIILYAALPKVLCDQACEACEGSIVGDLFFLWVVVIVLYLGHVAFWCCLMFSVPKAGGECEAVAVQLWCTG